MAKTNTAGEATTLAPQDEQLNRSYWEDDLELNIDLWEKRISNPRYLERWLSDLNGKQLAVLSYCLGLNHSATLKDQRKAILTMPDRLQKTFSPEDIRLQGENGRGETGCWITLSSQVKHVIRLALFYRVLQGNIVTKISVKKIYPVMPISPFNQMVHVVQRTAPAAHAINVPVGMFE